MRSSRWRHWLVCMRRLPSSSGAHRCRCRWWSAQLLGVSRRPPRRDQESGTRGDHAEGSQLTLLRVRVLVLVLVAAAAACLLLLSAGVPRPTSQPGRRRVHYMGAPRARYSLPRCRRAGPLALRVESSVGLRVSPAAGGRRHDGGEGSRRPTTDDRRRPTRRHPHATAGSAILHEPNESVGSGRTFHPRRLRCRRLHEPEPRTSTTGHHWTPAVAGRLTCRDPMRDSAAADTPTREDDRPSLDSRLPRPTRES